MFPAGLPMFLRPTLMKRDPALVARPSFLLEHTAAMPLPISPTQHPRQKGPAPRRPLHPPTDIVLPMAGHNKWSKIKRGKAIVDAKRGNTFSKLAKEITLAAKAGGGSPDMNARLRSAIAAAKAVNVPNDNIERAIKKGTGELAGAALEEILYEAYAPGGVAMMIEIVTDNRNRSANDIRTLLSKNNGTFADSGSVAYLFQRRGEIRLDKTAATEEQLMELAIEAGADDIADEGDDWIVYTPTDKLFQVAGALRDKNISQREQSLVYQPQTMVTISDVDTAKSLIRLYDLLNDYDDSQHIHANFEIDDAIADHIE